MLQLVENAVDPVELGIVPAAAYVAQADTFIETRQNIGNLNSVADGLGFLGTQYLVAANRGVAVPREVRQATEVDVIDFMEGLTFFGNLVSYAHVTVHNDWQPRAMDAVCLSFGDVTMLSTMRTIADTHLLHVPVLSIDLVRPRPLQT